MTQWTHIEKKTYYNKNITAAEHLPIKANVFDLVVFPVWQLAYSFRPSTNGFARVWKKFLSKLLVITPFLSEIIVYRNGMRIYCKINDSTMNLHANHVCLKLMRNCEASIVRLASNDEPFSAAFSVISGTIFILRFWVVFFMLFCIDAPKLHSNSSLSSCFNKIRRKIDHIYQ